MATRTRAALAQLEKATAHAIHAAGPRYTPGMDPAAPNIAIEDLAVAFDAVSLTGNWRSRILEHERTLRKATEHQNALLERHFARRISTPANLLRQLAQLRKETSPGQLRPAVLRARRMCTQILHQCDSSINALWTHERSIEGEDASRQRERVDTDVRGIQRVRDAVATASAYLGGTAGELLAGRNAVLLLGSWGTGKTHLLCDVAKQLLAHSKPALLMLASSLPAGMDILDGAAAATGLAATGDDLLRILDQLGEATGSRALLMFDAINEGDRDEWRKQLPRIAAKASRLQHVALVASCRRPFDETMIPARTRSKFATVEHYGFRDEEFDAQLEYFSFYGVPAPSIPLITPEFTRPLFLKILCESLRDLAKRTQKRKLREVASGQKGMTYVLEYYTREVGKGIEHDFTLPSHGCWKALKGEALNPGLAGTMADLGREWLTPEEASTSLQAIFGLPSKDAEALLRRFVTDGLLAEDVRWRAEGSFPVVQFSYQRFGDHLIARHLLDRHLRMDSEISLRRCFYANQPLGKPFRADRWGNQFASPGIAAAIMLEFPERMKRSHLPGELLDYLPKSRRLVQPVKEVFLEGLYWRSAESFTDRTDWMVSFFLTKADAATRDETLEVLVGLATRPGHPYSADRLLGYLDKMPMAQRDLIWSEFIRGSEEQGNVQRILAWIEMTSESDESVIRNEVRLASLFLTTTDRVLRDRATRALVTRGERRPDALFDETLRSLAFNDPYVAERMLAASYGVCMRNWADPTGAELRRSITNFARQLVRQMFLPNAPHATRHVLTRDYAAGVITLARRIDQHVIASRWIPFVRGQFTHIPSPFEDPASFSDADVQDGLGAMHMDFENYTIGHLIPDRSNYDSSHPEYQQVRRQIARRVQELGYSSEVFGEIDARIARYQPTGRDRDAGKVDRYGKKYAWIAFFEMFGIRLDARLLGDFETRQRTSDCDVDPSFPREPNVWAPPLTDIFTAAPRAQARWLASGPVPDYTHLLVRDDVDDIAGGPWVLLDGYVQESSSHQRQAFAFLRGVLISEADVESMEAEISDLDYLGNDRIPDGGADYYTYAGEIPWSERFGTYLRRRDGRAKRHTESAPYYWRPDRGWHGIARVEIPVHRWNWESYHSELNRASGVTFPAPALCEHLGLRNHARDFDLWDERGHRASIYREWETPDRYGGSHLLYLRQDLLKTYLRHTGQILVWVPWGERTLHYDVFKNHNRPAALQAEFQARSNSYRRVVRCDIR